MSKNFKLYKHIDLCDLDFYENDDLYYEFESYCQSDDQHYQVAYQVRAKDEDCDEWEQVLSAELISMGAQPHEFIFIATDF